MKKIITYGTFDLLTPGHIEQLRESKKLGDYLIVGLSTDEFNQIKNKKSYLSYEERKVILEAIKYVDEVIPEENWEQKIGDIKTNKISILTMGSDWEGSDKFDYLKDYCEVKFIPRSGKWASTHFRNFQEKHKDDHSLKNKIKNKIKIFIYIVFKLHLRCIYMFIKFFSVQKNRVYFLSRQFDEPDISFMKIIEKLPKGYDIKINCYRIKPNIKSYIKYYCNIYKQMYYLSTSKVVVIDGYNPSVSILNHKKNLCVIQLWHALGAIKKFGHQTLHLDTGRDKNISKILEMHRNYDYVISGSEAMKKPFSEAFNVDSSKILTMGTPNIDYMLEPLQDYKKYDIYIKIKNKPTILYAPTFRDNKPNDFENLLKSFNLKKYNVIVSIHPKAKDEMVLIDGVIYNPDVPFLDLIKMCDYFITDYSAAMLEAAIANKKLLLYVYDYHLYEKETGININLFDEYKYTSKKVVDIIKWIENDKFDMKVVNKFKNKYVTNLKGNSAQKICDLIKENMK